jgi:BirA family biotin operon repressor/biotin-[acetyl-CoA-carboxylase] ligase
VPAKGFPATLKLGSRKGVKAARTLCSTLGRRVDDVTFSPYADLSRPPLSQPAMARALARDPTGLWDEVHVLAHTGSTNADVAAAARAGRGEGLVVVAEEQATGRGRLGRAWVSPPRAGLTFSMLFRPDVAPARLPLLTLLVASATAQAIVERTDVEVRVKWPNDLVVGDRKLAGLLAEVAGGAVVVGVGLNVSTRREELPRSDATSVQLERGPGAEPVDRMPLLLAVLRTVGNAYRGWLETDGSAEAVLVPYRALSATLGRRVRAEMAPGVELVGTAVDVGPAGQLLVEDGQGRHEVSAADVIHLRPA